MPGRHSLERRLVWRLVAFFALALGAAIPIFLLSAWVEEPVEVMFRDRSLFRDIAEGVRYEDGRWRWEPNDRVVWALDQWADLEIALLGPGGVVLEGSSRRLAERMAPVMMRVERGTFQDGDSLVGIGTAALPLGQVKVAVSRRRLSLVDVLGWLRLELKQEILPVLLPLMILTLVIGLRTVRSVLAPLRRWSMDVAGMEPTLAGGLRLRMEESGVVKELLPLVQGFNRALGRVEDAYRRQHRFTANAAHELRTPLAILRARLDGLPPGPVCEGLVRDVSRISRVVEQLMAVARLEAGQLVLGERFDLVRLVRTILADIAPLALAQERSVALLAPNEAVMVEGNAAALEEALVNLLDNALRHTDEETGVEVEIRPPGRHGGVVVVEVRDCGPGIPEGECAQVFDPFWRGRDRRSGGSGLGLAIVAETVALHRGRVSVRPREGGGSIFAVELPPAPSPAAPMPRPAQERRDGDGHLRA